MRVFIVLEVVKGDESCFAPSFPSLSSGCGEEREKNRDAGENIEDIVERESGQGLWEEGVCVTFVVDSSLSHVWLFCDPMDCILPGSSVRGIYQARMLARVVISFSRVSSWPWDWTGVYCTGSQILHHWATREASVSPWSEQKWMQKFAEESRSALGRWWYRLDLNPKSSNKPIL